MQLRKWLRKYVLPLKLVLKLPFRFMCKNIKNFSRAMYVCPFKSRNTGDYAPAAAWTPIPFGKECVALLFSLPLLQMAFQNGEQSRAALLPSPLRAILHGTQTVALLGLIRVWWAW